MPRPATGEPRPAGITAHYFGRVVVQNKVIIISGATSGIGLACARTLAAAGATVVGFGRSAEKVSALKGTPGWEKIRLESLDIRNSEAVTAFVESVVQEHGKIDGLVNAAGLLNMDRAHQVTDESLDEQLDVLLKGTFRLTRQVLGPMRKKKSGLVINIGSVSGARPAPGHAVYGAAKAAVQHLTTSLALEYAPRGIRFLCVSPGPVETGLMDGLMFEMLAKKIPLGRLGRPEEVAALVEFLFSDRANFMTGSTITLDGGAAL